MSIMNALNTAVYSALTSATALTGLLATTTSVYSQHAPDGAALPYVVYSVQGGGPLNDTPSDARSALYWVRGYSTNQAQAGTIDAQISTVLHRGALTVTGYTHVGTVRETDIQLLETLPDRSRVYTAGATYTILVDS